MDNVSSFEYEIFPKNDVYYLQVSRYEASLSARVCAIKFGAY